MSTKRLGWKLKKDLPGLEKGTEIYRDQSEFYFDLGVTKAHIEYQSILYRCFCRSEELTSERGDTINPLDKKLQVKRNIDWSGVLKTAQSILDEIESGNYHEDNDNDVYLSEAVMSAIYGDPYWEKLNNSY